MFFWQENVGLGANLRNSKRSFFIFAGSFLVIMLVAGGGYFVWKKYS